MSIHGREGKLYYALGRIHTHKTSVWFEELSHVFSKFMSKVLKDLNWKIALVYIDDILIFSKNFDEHLHHLDQVFQNLRAANLKFTLENVDLQFRRLFTWLTG